MDREQPRLEFLISERATSAPRVWMTNQMRLIYPRQGMLGACQPSLLRRLKSSSASTSKYDESLRVHISGSIRDNVWCCWLPTSRTPGSCRGVPGFGRHCSVSDGVHRLLLDAWKLSKLFWLGLGLEEMAREILVRDDYPAIFARNTQVFGFGPSRCQHGRSNRRRDELF